MKAHLFFVAPILAVSLMVVGCGSSSDSSTGAGGGTTSSGTSGGATDVACTFTQGASMSCIQYGNLQQAQIDGIKQSCSAQPSGKVVDSCPTDKLLGCCAQKTAGIDTATCYYEAMGLTADSLKMACGQAMGTWGTKP
jgi:hypothetical protein